MSVSGKDGAFGFAYGDLGGTVSSSAGHAAGVTYGDASGLTVSGDKDAAVLATGTFTGALSAGHDAGAVALGGFTGNITSGGHASIASEGAVSGSVLAGKDVFVLAHGDITGGYLAGRDAGLVTYADFNAGVLASRDVAYVYAGGDLSGAIAGDRAVGQPSRFSSGSGDFTDAAGSGVFAWGNIAATIAAPNLGGATDAGRISGVAAVGNISGSVSAAASIGDVHAGGTVSAGVTAPSVTSIESALAALSGLTAPSAPASVAAGANSDAAAVRSDMVDERNALDAYFANLSADLTAARTAHATDIATTQADNATAVSDTKTRAARELAFATSTAASLFSNAVADARDDMKAFENSADVARAGIEHARDRLKAFRSASAARASVTASKEAVRLVQEDLRIQDRKAGALSTSIGKRAVRDAEWAAEHETVATGSDWVLPVSPEMGEVSGLVWEYDGQSFLLSPTLAAEWTRLNDRGFWGGLFDIGASDRELFQAKFEMLASQALLTERFADDDQMGGYEFSLLRAETTHQHQALMLEESLATMDAIATATGAGRAATTGLRTILQRKVVAQGITSHSLRRTGVRAGIENMGRKPQVFIDDLSHVTGRTAVARERAIRSLLKEDLAGLNMRHRPEYSPFIRTGIAKRGTGTQIGKKPFGSRRDLMNTVVHEELHHRWWERGILGAHHPAGSTQEARFYEVIRRYMRLHDLE